MARRRGAPVLAPRGSVALNVGFQYLSLAFAGLFGAIPMVMWLASIPFLLGAGEDHSTFGKSEFWGVLGGVCAIAIVIAPWLVPCLVLRARQPRGARIEWDEEEITEWDGPWKRNAIRWTQMEAAHVEWMMPTKAGSLHQSALQIFDTESKAVISVWESEPKGAPVVRRRVHAAKLGELVAALRHHRISMARAADWTRVEDPDRHRSKWVYVARLGYFGGLFGPLVAFSLPWVGMAIGVTSAALLAWRARPVMRELALVRARLASSPNDPRAAADRLKIRAVWIEALARGSFVVLTLLASASCAFAPHA